MGVGYSIRAKASGAAEVFIYEDVGDMFGGVSARQFTDDLRALGAVDQIDVRINSYGGGVFDGLAIYRQLVEHPANIVVHIDGIAASIASVIAMAGDEIRIAEAGMMMIHPAQGGCLGSSVEMREMADLLDRITTSITNVYVQRTGANADQVAGWVARDTWFTAAEAVANGFADRVEENMRLAARLDLAGHQARYSDGQANARHSLRPAAKELVSLREAGQVADQLAARPAPALAAARSAQTSASRPRLIAANDLVARMRARAPRA